MAASSAALQVEGLCSPLLSSEWSLVRKTLFSDKICQMNQEILTAERGRKLEVVRGAKEAMVFSRERELVELHSRLGASTTSLRDVPEDVPCGCVF